MTQNLSGYLGHAADPGRCGPIPAGLPELAQGRQQGRQGPRGITTVTEGTAKIAHNPLTELTASQKSYPLQRRNLAKIAALGKLKVPSTPELQTHGVLAHLGVGGFHRSHQAYVTDVLLERATSRSVPDSYDNARRVSYKQLPGSGGDLNEIADVWGILGVGLMPYFLGVLCVAFARR